MTTAQWHRMRRFRHRLSGWAWALCLLAAFAQGALPIVHAGHPNGSPAAAGTEAKRCGATAIVLTVAHQQSDEASCPICRAIGMTRSAVFLPCADMLAIGPSVEVVAATSREIGREVPRLTTAPPRGPPALG